MTSQQLQASGVNMQQSRKVVFYLPWGEIQKNFGAQPSCSVMADGGARRHCSCFHLELFSASLSKNPSHINRPTVPHPLWNHRSQGKSSSNAKSNSLASALAVSSPRRTSLLCNSAKAVNSMKPTSKINICASIETAS